MLVTTVRALKHHGGNPAGGVAEVERGAANLQRHLGIVREFGLNAVVAVNRFPDDTDDETDTARRLALAFGARAAEVNDGFMRGGAGAVALAEAVAEAADAPADFRPIYQLEDPIDVKIGRIATRVYGADGVVFQPAAQAAIRRFAEQGYGTLPVCMAKTHLSLSHDPTLLNAPTGFTVPVRDLRAYTGAGWLVALCGDMMTMPGLGAAPAAVHVDIDRDGRTVGLF